MNDTIFVVLICILSVMHYVILNLKRIFNPPTKPLQRILERHLTRPFFSAMLRCDCKVTWLEIHCKMKGGRTKGAEFSEVFQGFCLRL